MGDGKKSGVLFPSCRKSKLTKDALSNKIVLCSPNNLYAMLSVVRQASKYYVLEKASKEVLELMQKFNKEWGNFIAKFDKVDKAIDNLRKVFNEVSTTRKNKLDSILNDIEAESRNALPKLNSEKERENIEQ